MKFKDVKYATQFIARGLEIHAITDEQVEEVMECEINLGIDPEPESADPGIVCIWNMSGIAGKMIDKIFIYDTSWRATDEPTPCQSCEALKVRVKELEGILKAHGIGATTHDIDGNTGIS